MIFRQCLDPSSSKKLCKLFEEKCLNPKLAKMNFFAILLCHTVVSLRLGYRIIVHSILELELISHEIYWRALAFNFFVVSERRKICFEH